jgi:hypothetical protein
MFQEQKPPNIRLETALVLVEKSRRSCGTAARKNRV